MSCTVEQTEFLENLRLHLIDLSRRLEQDSGDDVADYIYNTQHCQQTCALRVKFKSCGSRTIKGERTLSIELQS